MKDVFERQRMQVEGHAEIAQHFGAGPARHVDPGMARRAEVEATFVDLHPMHDLDIVLRIFDQGKVEGLVGDGGATGKRSGRSTGLGMPVDDTVHASPHASLGLFPDSGPQISSITCTSGRPAR